MNQALILAEMIMLRTWRSRLIQAFLLVALPLLPAIWLINADNPGYQTIFAKDIGGVFLHFAALAAVVILALDHLFKDEKPDRDWFISGRVRNRLHLILGHFLGMAFSLMALLVCISLFFLAFYRLLQGAWLLEILFAGYLIFLESCILIAALILLAELFSRFMAISGTFIVYLLANSGPLQALKTAPVEDVYGFLLSFALTLVPDFSMFNFSGLILESEALNSPETLISTFYALFLTGVYLLLAEQVSRRKNA